MPTKDKAAPEIKSAPPVTPIAPAKRRAAPGTKILAAADLRKRRAKGQDTRERILNAAAEEFARYGLEGASIRSIAAHTGVSHTRFVYYFDSKEGLWQAVVERACTDLIKRYAAPLENADKVSDAELLKRIYTEYIRFAAENPHVSWIMSHSSREGGETARWRIKTFVAPSFKVVDDLIASAQKTGEHIAGDPSHLHLLFMGAAGRIFMIRGEVEGLTKLKITSRKFIEEHTRLCLSLFFRDPPPAKGRGRKAAAAAG